MAIAVAPTATISVLTKPSRMAASCSRLPYQRRLKPLQLNGSRLALNDMTTTTAMGMYRNA